MATLPAAAILTRIREVLEDSAGILRTVPTGRFEGGLPEGGRVDSELAKAFVKPRIEAAITGMSLSAATPPVVGNLRIYDLEVEVRVVRIIRPLEQVSDDDRVALQAAAATDADIIAQALGWPGNLTQTAASTATDLVSGMLTYQRTRARIGRRIDEGAQPLETIHTFTGKAQVRPAVA